MNAARTGYLVCLRVACLTGATCTGGRRADSLQGRRHQSGIDVISRGRTCGHHLGCAFQQRALFSYGFLQPLYLLLLVRDLLTQLLQLLCNRRRLCRWLRWGVSCPSALRACRHQLQGHDAAAAEAQKPFKIHTLLRGNWIRFKRHHSLSATPTGSGKALRMP